jgi:hypothetical protein
MHGLSTVSRSGRIIVKKPFYGKTSKNKKNTLLLPPIKKLQKKNTMVVYDENFDLFDESNIEKINLNINPLNTNDDDNNNKNSAFSTIRSQVSNTVKYPTSTSTTANFPLNIYSIKNWNKNYNDLVMNKKNNILNKSNNSFVNAVNINNNNNNNNNNIDSSNNNIFKFPSFKNLFSNNNNNINNNIINNNNKNENNEQINEENSKKLNLNFFIDDHEMFLQNNCPEEYFVVL